MRAHRDGVGRTPGGDPEVEGANAATTISSTARTLHAPGATPPDPREVFRFMGIRMERSYASPAYRRIGRC